MLSLGHSVGVVAINLYANKGHPVAKATLSSGETAYHVVFFFKGRECLSAYCCKAYASAVMQTPPVEMQCGLLQCLPLRNMK